MVLRTVEHCSRWNTISGSLTSQCQYCWAYSRIKDLGQTLLVWMESSKPFSPIHTTRGTNRHLQVNAVVDTIVFFFFLPGKLSGCLVYCLLRILLSFFLFSPLAALSCHMQRQNLSMSAVAACDLIGRNFFVKTHSKTSVVSGLGTFLSNMIKICTTRKSKRHENDYVLVSPRCFVFYLHCCNSSQPM